MVVHAVDGVRVCEKYFHLGEGLFCFTIGAILELITLDTCALKGSVQIFALLVAEIPFFAFISIDTSSRVIPDLLANRTGTSASFKRASAFKLTSEGRAETVGAGILLIRAIIAVRFSITEFAFIDAFWCSVFSTLGAVEFIIGARDSRTILLVSPVGAILISIASPACWDTKCIFAPELSAVAGGKIAILLVGPIAALVPVVALLILLNTFLSVSALEFRQLARNSFFIAIFLVAFVSAVVISIANVFLRNP
jgi:hypothetical protein